MRSIMVKRYLTTFALALWQGAAALAGNAPHAVPVRSEPDAFPEWRAAAARVLATRGDAGSLATAAALTFLGPPSRSRTDSAGAATGALALAVRASELAPNSAALSWLRLQLCTYAPGCDIRDAATTMRWVAADNGAAWLPTLTVAQRDKDTMEIDRALASMAQGTHFDLYGNHTTAMMYAALKSVRGRLPAHYLATDAARLNEAIGIANAVILPSFSPLINACREALPDSERHEICLSLAKTMQHADAVMAQLVGFAIEKRLTPSDARELHTIAERRRLLEWRVATANQTQTPARWRIAKMRVTSREEELSIAILRQHRLPLEPPEDRR